MTTEASLDSEEQLYGLQGLSWLERLHQTGLSNWNLYLLTTGSSLAASLLTIPFLDSVNPDSIFKDYFTSQVLFITLSVNFLLVGFIFFVTVAMARTTEADIRAIATIDSQVVSCFSTLKPDRLSVRLSATVFLIALWLFSPVQLAVSTEISLVAALKHHLAAGPITIFLFFLLPVLLSWAFGMSFAVVKNQIKSLLQVASTVEVNLQHLNSYQFIASPLIRYLMIVLIIFSGIPPITLYVDNTSFNESVLVTAAVMIFIFGPVVAGYFSPVFVLRNRIRHVKQTQLDLIARAQIGDPEAVETLQPANSPFPAPDLLTRQMFVESRWEWPIAAHVQKLILFGLLPPITWVLAAIIENTLF